MEQTVTETLSLGLLVCRLLLGTAACGDGASPAMPSVDPCAGTLPRYELAIGGATVGSESAAVLAERLARPGICDIAATVNAAGELVLEIATAEDPMPLVVPMLQPGTVTFFAVDEGRAPDQPLPDDLQVLPDIDGQSRYVVDRTPLLDGSALAFAEADLSIYDEWTITLGFTNDGRERFSEITTDSVGHLLAIALDGHVLSAPRITTPIHGGRAQISGNFTEDEARGLAALIASGPLPAGLSVLSIEAAPK